MARKKRAIVFNISNKLAYTLIVILSIVLIGVGVYALTPGVAPNPGHTIDYIAPPAGCISGQVLTWTSSGWSCQTVWDCITKTASGTGSADARCDEYYSCISGSCIASGTDGIYSSYENAGGWKCTTSAGNTIIAQAFCCKISFY